MREKVNKHTHSSDGEVLESLEDWVFDILEGIYNNKEVIKVGDIVIVHDEKPRSWLLLKNLSREEMTWYELPTSRWEITGQPIQL